MLHFHCVEPSVRGCNSSRGQGERANIERHVIDHLQDTVNISKRKVEKEQQTFHLVHFFYHLVKSDYKPNSVRVVLVSLERRIPKFCRILIILSIGALSSNGTYRQKDL